MGHSSSHFMSVCVLDLAIHYTWQARLMMASRKSNSKVSSSQSVLLKVKFSCHTLRSLEACDTSNSPSDAAAWEAHTFTIQCTSMKRNWWHLDLLLSLSLFLFLSLSLSLSRCPSFTSTYCKYFWWIPRSNCFWNIWSWWCYWCYWWWPWCHWYIHTYTHTCTHRTQDVQYSPCSSSKSNMQDSTFMLKGRYARLTMSSEWVSEWQSGPSGHKLPLSGSAGRVIDLQVHPKTERQREKDLSRLHPNPHATAFLSLINDRTEH